MEPQRGSFIIKPVEFRLSMQKVDRMLEIADDGGLKSVLEKTTLSMSWIKWVAENPKIATTAMKTLLTFVKSYLCEASGVFLQ